MKLLQHYAAVCLLLLPAWSGRAQVLLSHLESPLSDSPTVASATVSGFTGHPPTVVFANAKGAASGSFSSPGGASGSFIIRYKGYKVFDKNTFALGSLHELHLAGSSYPNTWGVNGQPGGSAVSRANGTNEAILIHFDLSGLTLGPDQTVVLKSVKASGNQPQHAAIVRKNGPGSTTLFRADALGRITIDEVVLDGEAFAYIHDSSQGGSRLDTITIDIVELPLITVDPSVVFGPGTDVTVVWKYPDAPTGATVEVSADRPVTFGSLSGNAASGSVVATVADGANGDVRFSLSVRNGETEIATGKAVVQGYPAPSPGPNILLITSDDLSADSVGAFGCPVSFTTPTIDNLAASGVRFEHAHVVVASCNPSRNVIMSGLYPHTSGVEGFRNYPNTTHMLLPELLKRNGYFVGIYNKVSHTTPAAYAWDMSLDKTDLYNKTAQSYYTATKQGISGALAAGKPFFLNINISDPHLPYYGIKNKSTELLDDPDVPSRLYKPSEIVVPDFLPDSGDVPLELAHYYMSVRRGDDCFAKILEAIDELHLRDHTLILFLSDHGMPQPFAKACIYHQSTRTPLIFSWPGVIAPGTVDDTHMVSAVDIMPTLLDAVGLPHPYGMEGRSFFGALLGQSLSGFDHVIKEADETNNEQRMPMRSVQTHRYGYIFNTWSDGIRDIANATEGTLADQRMEELAAAGWAKWVARDNLFEYRTKEEFYDYENDPAALNNLINSSNSAIQDEIARHRDLLMAWMGRTHDHALVAFQNLEDDAAIDAYWESQKLNPPVVSESTKLQRMMDDLRIDVVPPRFRLAVDPRLTETTWECLLSTNLLTWDSRLLTDPNVSYDPITGRVEVHIDTNDPALFFRLRGAVTD